MWSARSNSVAQTMNLGRAVARHARAGDVIALVGDLGVGKTQFVRGLAVGMGIEPRDVASPTFVVIHEYPTPDDRPPLIHIDGYRLTGLHEIESIGWDRPAPEMLYNAVVAIEWADRLADQLGDDVLTVTLSHAGECQRDVRITPEGSWLARMDALARTLEQLSAETPLEPQKLRPKPVALRKCSVCREPVTQENPAFPFCSARCKTIDLGRWAAEEYIISRPIERSDLEEGE